jgi:hypothetical protein
MNKLKQYLLAGSIGIANLLPVLAKAAPTAAVTTIPGLPTSFSTFDKIVSGIFSWSILAAGIIFVFLILLGGIQYLTALGEEEGTIKARKIIINGTIGLVIVLSAFAVGTFVLATLGIGTSGQLKLTTP